MKSSVSKLLRFGSEALDTDKKYWVALALTCVLLLFCLARNPAARPEIDVDQPKSGSISLALTESYTVGQSFVATHPNLTGIELYPALYGETDASSPTPARLIIHLRVDPHSNTDLATLELEETHLQTGEPARFTFAPLPDSRGKRYYLLLEGTADNRAGVLYSDLDVYTPGRMDFGGQPTDADLRFSTLYRYDLKLMLLDTAHALANEGWLAFPLVALLFVPGFLLLRLIGQRAIEGDALSQLALSLGLSLAITPLGMLWLTVLGTRMSRVLILGSLGVASPLITASVLFVQHRKVRPNLRPQLSNHAALRPSLHVVVGFGLLALILTLRLLQIHDVMMPLWVDSIHHTLITRLIQQTGQIPSSYRPFFDSEGFFYHFGFHAHAASFSWMSQLPATRAILILGQVLNAGVSLTAYHLATRLSGRRSVGLITMFITGLVSAMPAYYVNWGRYTLLAGLTILPVAISLSIGAAERRKDAHRCLVLAAITWAGLFVTHYNVFVFGVTFLLLYFVAAVLVRGQATPRPSKALSRMALMALIAGIVMSPWLIRLSASFGWPPRTLPGKLWLERRLLVADLSSISVGPDLALSLLAIGGILLGIYRRQRFVVLLALWTALLWIYANAYALGLPTTWILETFTVRISMFLPQVVLAGYLVTEVFEFLFRWPLSTPNTGLSRYLWYRSLPAIAVTIPLVVGCVRNVPASVNQAAVLFTPDDMTAMNWIIHNTSPDSMFLINMRIWTNSTYMGGDGGSWIQMLTDRPTTWPSLNYTLGDPSVYRQVNGVASALESARSIDEPSLQEWIDVWGVEYVYIGAKNGKITPRMLLDAPDYYSQVYTNGPVWIFKVKEKG